MAIFQAIHGGIDTEGGLIFGSKLPQLTVAIILLLYLFIQDKSSNVLWAILILFSGNYISEKSINLYGSLSKLGLILNLL